MRPVTRAMGDSTVERHDAAEYGERIAAVYDDWYSPLDALAPALLITELAGPGPVLELGIGTGRVALQLAERGVTVHGIDASEAMVDRLRAKPGGDAIPVTIGDFADVPVEESYSLIFVAFNTLFSLPTQEDQIRCFQNVADRLTDDGLFVVEAFVPDLGRFDRGSRVSVDQIAEDSVRLEVSLHDAARQSVESRHVVIAAEGIDMYPVRVRYAWPAELDLMARLAGLRLKERWGGWKREPFSSYSRNHVTVYEASK